MTKIHLLVTALVISAGALTGLLLPALLPYPSDKPATTWVSRLDLAWASAQPAARSGEVDDSVYRRVVNFLTGNDVTLAGVRKGSAHMMLNQNVLVLNDASGEQALELQKGTQVRLVANEGRFVRVSHGNKIVTIPRSAVVVGVARTN